jgi:thiamine pyrophosphokinase
MHALIICDGQRPSLPLLQREVALANLVIATDGAATWLREVGVNPQVVVGDFDSLTTTEGDWEVVHAGAHDQQENSDAEKALLLALARGATAVTMVGATGQRLDHTLANLWLLATYHEHADVLLADDYGTCRVVSGYCTLAAEPGDVISLLALTPQAVVRSKGLKWPLDGPLAPGSRGLSNVAETPEVTVEVTSGLVAVFTVIEP